MSHRFSVIVVALLSLMLLVQVGARAYQTWRASPNGGSFSYVRIDPGARLEVSVTAGAASPAVAFSDLAPGRCAYVVLYSPTCGASAVSAKRWTIGLDIEGGLGAVFPPEWTPAWVSVEDPAASAGFLPPGFVIPQFFRHGAVRIEPALGMMAYPAHVILDREGRVVSGGVGAPLPTRDQLAPSCELRSPG